VLWSSTVAISICALGQVTWGDGKLCAELNELKFLKELCLSTVLKEGSETNTQGVMGPRRE